MPNTKDYGLLFSLRFSVHDSKALHAYSSYMLKLYVQLIIPMNSPKFFVTEFCSAVT